MKRYLWAAAVLVLAVGISAWAVLKAKNRSESDAPQVVRLDAGETLEESWPAEEVFRRAFWRNPTSSDRIVHAIRQERSALDGVNHWAWFVMLHPGEDLLSALKNPSTFDLISTENPRKWEPSELPLPKWFTPKSSAGWEIYQHPVQPLTLFYQPEENLLFASDYGQGFARPSAP